MILIQNVIFCSLILFIFFFSKLTPKIKLYHHFLLINYLLNLQIVYGRGGGRV